MQSCLNINSTNFLNFVPGNDEPIGCKQVQEMRKSLNNAVRELGKTKEQLGHLKSSTTMEKERTVRHNYIA